MILATSAEIETLKAERQREYCATMAWLERHAGEHQTVFLECVKPEASFIEGRFPVFYGRRHNPAFRNKGANLGRALQRFVRDYPHNEATVLQITGRYCFLDRSFLEHVERNPGFEFYGREILELSGPNLERVRMQYFTGCFAMARDALADWVETTDWDALEAHMENVERALWEYVQSRRLRASLVESTRMACNVFGDGRQPTLCEF